MFLSFLNFSLLGCAVKSPEGLSAAASGAQQLLRSYGAQSLAYKNAGAPHFFAFFARISLQTFSDMV